jgi:branched-chain amino acid transport system ATP-binding protein
MLSLASVSAGYGSFQALFGVSLDVSRGEAVGVIGPNGAGKTTLMRVISGMLPMSEGAMTIEGQPIGGLPAHHIIGHGIAHVPENRRLFPRLTVEENLRVGAFIPSARARFAEQLDWVYSLFPRLKDRRAQAAGTMSGGEQQMCAIGRALMARPKLLLLDEPSLGLAPIFVERIFDIIKQINEQGTSILLVEQNALMALDAANRGYVLETGRIVLADEAAALKTNEQVRKTYLGET